jgi:hypothetical protein
LLARFLAGKKDSKMEWITEWIFVSFFCILVAVGAWLLGKKSDLIAIIWTAIWSAVFAVAFWPF